MNILSVLEIIVLKKASGPKMEEIIGEWRKLHKRSIASCTFTKRNFSHLVKKDEIGGTSHGTRQGDENVHRTIVTGGRWS
jgi:hypothetical protein